MTELARQAWPQLVERAGLLVIPLGATEQHGPHLPLDTDTAIATALGRRLVSRVDRVVLAPAVPYGASGEHQEFAGTLSIGLTAVQLLLLELGRSATLTFPRVLFLSAHGGNREAVSEAVRQLRREGRDARAWSPARQWQGDAHAGRVETSVMLALRSADVRLERATAGETRQLAEIMPQLRAAGVAALSSNGVLGDPAGASCAEGEELLSAAVDRLAAAVAAWPDRAGDWL